MLERFPNSSNVLRLYSRFTAVILADRDYAKELSESAKDNEVVNKKDPSKAAEIEGVENRSVASSSNASDNKNKEALLLKKKREMMEERLDAPIKGFLRNANLFTLFFILLMAASASLSYTQIFKTNDALQTQGFGALLSRTTLQRLNLHYRKLSYFTSTANGPKFTETMKDLYSELQLWNKDVMKLYFSGPGTTLNVDVKEWDGKHFTIKQMNALQASILISTYAQNVNETGVDLFKNRTAALLHPSVRFILDNSNNLMHFYTQIRDVEIQDHYIFINMLRTALLSCKSAIAILAFTFSLIIPYFSYNSFKERHFKIMDMLLKLPKKPVLDILTTIEEEIELIAVDDKQLISGKSIINENARRWKFVLPGRYLMAITLFYIVNVIKVYFVINHVDTTVLVPFIFNVRTFIGMF